MDMITQVDLFFRIPGMLAVFVTIVTLILFKYHEREFAKAIILIYLVLCCVLTVIAALVIITN